MKPKIALINDNMDVLNGLNRVVGILCNELSAVYDVYLICLWGTKNVYPINAEVHEYCIDDKQRRLRYSLFHSVKAIRKFLKEENIKIVLCEGPIPLIGTFLATHGLSVKLIFHEHSSSEVRLATKSKSVKQAAYVRLVQYIINRYSSEIVVLTEKEAQVYAERFRGPKERIHVLYNFLEDKLIDESEQYDETARALITVGRIEYQKGYEYLIDTARKVFARHPDWHWDIYGEGEEEYTKQIQNLIAKNKLEDHVFLKGTQANLYDVYPKYGIYAMTSRYEGLPMVLLEAKAKKLPIVSFDIHAGPSDIIRDGVDGYLVPPFDTDGMAEKICYLIEHPEVRKDFSDHAYGNIDKFRKETIMAKWKDLIDGMME